MSDFIAFMRKRERMIRSGRIGKSKFSNTAEARKKSRLAARNAARKDPTDPFLAGRILTAIRNGTYVPSDFDDKRRISV